MKFIQFFVIASRILGFLILPMLVHGTVVAGMLDMPDVRDSSSLKGKSVYENIDVPPVRERDPNPQGGPRVWVLKIKLQGVVDRPKYGITKQALEEYAEKIRADSMKEDELLKFGYSLEDLGKIADLMVDIDAGKNMEQVTEPDLQRLIWLVRELKDKRGLTLVNIEDIAEKLTNYYRERGFFLTKVYVPQQQVRKGVVVLNVLEGKLGKVTVDNNERYDNKILTSPFDNLMYQPVTEKEVEQALYLLNDFPGLDVYGYFKAGDQVGDTWLNLQVRGEKLWSAVARVDNHGSELTGQQRAYVEVEALNPLKNADSITVGMLKSFNPDNSTYGMLRYRQPVWIEQLHLGVNYSRNQFATVVGGLDFTGETRIKEALLDYTHIRRKEMNWISSVSYARKDSNLTATINSDLDLGDVVQNLTLGMRFDALDTQSAILNQANIAFTQGSIITGAAPGQDDKFNKLAASYSILSFLKIPWIDASTRLIFKSSLQYSKVLLPSVEQFSLSGPNRVRAYDATQFSADNALYLGVDWVFNLPDMLDFKLSDSLSAAKVVQPFVFMDAAYGEIHLINTDTFNRARLSGYGVGLQLNYNNQMSGNLQLAKPWDNYFSQEYIQKPKDKIRVILDFQYLFN